MHDVNHFCVYRVMIGREAGCQIDLNKDRIPRCPYHPVQLEGPIGDEYLPGCKDFEATPQEVLDAIRP